MPVERNNRMPSSSSTSDSKTKTNRGIPILPVRESYNSKDNALHLVLPKSYSSSNNDARYLEYDTKISSGSSQSQSQSQSTGEEVEFVSASAYAGNNSRNIPKSGSNDSNSSNSNNNNNYCNYEGFPLVQSMMATETTRTKALTREGAKQMEYPKSNAGWLRTLLVLEGRALDRILIPWTIVTLNALAWSVCYDRMGWLVDPQLHVQRKTNIQGILELVLTTTMAFLLVFRLNRSATRFWLARAAWGNIVAKSRGMVGTVLLYGSHDPCHRDRAVRWIAAFSIASMNHTRGLRNIDPRTVEGILAKDELETLNAAVHPPLHAADEIRCHLAGLFDPASIGLAFGSDPNLNFDSNLNSDSKNPDRANSNSNDCNAARSIALSQFRTQQLVSLEQQLNVLIDEVGALERIKATPLPLVYVTHLRTWLMVYLLTMPYFWESSMGYALIPVVCMAAFALLGLEGAAAEVEAPFLKHRTNHLDMDCFCLAVLSNVLQQAKEDAVRKKRGILSKPTNYKRNE